MQCEFIKLESGKFKCKNCGALVPTDKIQTNCRYGINTQITHLESTSLIHKEPPLYQKIINFAQAAVKHTIKGNPTVSEEVVKKRLQICQSCELFKLNANQVGGVCTHSTCGCTIQDNTNYLNKIAWADQKCPIDKWGEENPDNNKKEGV